MDGWTSQLYVLFSLLVIRKNASPEKMQRVLKELELLEQPTFQQGIPLGGPDKHRGLSSIEEPLRPVLEAETA